MKLLNAKILKKCQSSVTYSAFFKNQLFFWEFPPDELLVLSYVLRQTTRELVPDEVMDAKKMEEIRGFYDVLRTQIDDYLYALYYFQSPPSNEDLVLVKKTSENFSIGETIMIQRGFSLYVALTLESMEIHQELVANAIDNYSILLLNRNRDEKCSHNFLSLKLLWYRLQFYNEIKERNSDFKELESTSRKVSLFAADVALSDLTEERFLLTPTKVFLDWDVIDATCHSSFQMKREPHENKTK